MFSDDDIPVVMGTPAARHTPAALAAAIDGAFSQRLPTPHLSTWYLLSLLAVGSFAFALPFLYLLLPLLFSVLGIGWLMVGFSFIRGWNTAALVMGPSFGLLAAAWALLSPLFRRRRPAGRAQPVVVNRASDPGGP